jgi:hypothetical protein
VSEPKPLNPTEQDALVKQIGLTLMRAAPEGWHHVTAEYRATGRYFELSAEVRSEDGSARGWAPPQDVATLFARLRAGMHREGRGSWSNARYQLDQPSSYNLDFDRAEPKWQTPPPQQAYYDEMRFFPRSEENVPDWLRKWLQPPAAPAPAAPPPPRSFRTARVFDGAGPGGRPSVNRPPVPEHERDLLLDYLDRAPVAVVGRGFDADVLDGDSPSIVPVAFQTDGNWIWPAAVGYYLRTYGVPPEPELVERARAAEFRVTDVSEEARVAAAANLGAPPAPRGTGLPQPAQLEVHAPEEEPGVQVAPLDDGFAAFADAHPLELPADFVASEYDTVAYDPHATIATPLPEVEPEKTESAHALDEEPAYEPMSPVVPDIEETADLVDLRPALADEQADADFDQRQFDAAQDGPPYRVQFDHDAEPAPAVDDRYRRESYVEGMDLFAPSVYERDESDTQAWSPFADEEPAPEPIDTGVEPMREPIPADETEEEIQPEVLAAEAGLVVDDLVAAEPVFEVDADPRRHDDTTEFDIDQDTVFDIDPVAVPVAMPAPLPVPLPVAEPEPVPEPVVVAAPVPPPPPVPEPVRPRQVTPEEERELSGVRRALDDLDVPPAAYRFGEPADRTWGLRTAGDGWEVAWFDHGPNNPVRFERVGDAAAFLIGKLVLGGRRAPRQAPPPPPLPPRPPQVNGFREEPPRRPPMPPQRPVEQALTSPPPRPEPAQAQESAGQAGRSWPIKPLNGEPPLTLFRHKKMIELPSGFEIDRFGDPTGNLCYAAGTPFEERSLVPSWINRAYRVYRLRRPVEVLTGVAVPWFEQPGGGTAYLFPKTIEEMIVDGALVEVSNQEAQTH